MAIVALVYAKVKISIWISGDEVAYYKRLRELREDHDLSQRDIAKMLEISQPQYCLYEKGFRDIPSDLLIRLAKLYNTSTDYIYELSDDPRLK